MPYMVVKRKNKYHVFKQDADGNPTGKSLGEHETKAEARMQQKALYAAEKKPNKEMIGGAVISYTWDVPAGLLVEGATGVATQIVEQEGDSNKGYAYLGVHWEWEIEQFYRALNTIFAYDEDWTWQDPSTWHVTLAYSDNVTTEQLLDVAKAISGMDAVRLKFSGIGTFETEDERVVYLKVEKNDELVALQSSIYDALAAQGVEMSPNSAPESWTPHLTLARVALDKIVPEVVVHADTYASKVCLARDDYRTLAEVYLEWHYETPSDDGSAPMMEMAQRTVEQKAASWKVGAGRGMMIMDGDPEWSGSEAAKSVFDACGFDGDNPDMMMARKAFLLFNSAAPKLKGSYKVPIAKWSDGKLMVVPAGLRNAASRLPQVKGVPKDVIDRAQKVLDSYKKKAGIGEMDASATRTPVRLTFISEMRGGYPDIPLPKDIDTTELERIVGEGNLDFVTLPIGQVDAKSGNGRTYKRAAVEELVQGINEFRLEGMWGHLDEDELATRYDPPAIRWLAAMLDKKGIAWGKGLPLNAATRDYFRIARATNARVGTSLVAMAEMRGMDVEHLEPKGVDLADPMRVGVPVTAALPHLTREMGGTGSIMMPDGTNNHDLFVRIREQRQMESPSETEAKQKNSESVAVKVNEMAENAITQEQYDALKAEKDTIVARATETETKLGEAAEREKSFLKVIGELIREQIVHEVEHEVALEGARDLVVEQVIAMQPQSVEAVKTAVKTVLEKPSMVKLLKVQVAEQMGPPQPKQPGASGRDIDPIKKYLGEMPKIDIPNREAVQ